MNIPIVFSSDHNFIMPTGVAILSMLQHSSDCKPIIYIFQSKDVTAEDRKNLESICVGYHCEIHFVQIDDSFNGAFEIRGITTATYYRLLIPWILPQYEKVIYCDGDVIFQQSLSWIYSFDIKNNYVAGVRTGGFLHSSGYKYAKKLGLDGNNYINGGVLLINSKVQRELRLKEEYLEHASKKYKFQDQDIVNIVCKNHIGFMPRWFNVTPSFQKDILLSMDSNNLDINISKLDVVKKDFKIFGDTKYPVIIHFAGAKPWKEFTCFWVNWWEYYSKTPFYDLTLSYGIEVNEIKKIPSIRGTFRALIKYRFPAIYYYLKRLMKSFC